MSESIMLANTYVYYDGDAFNVSTIDRESSAPYGGRYSETIVWDVPRQKILHMDSGIFMDVGTHCLIVSRINDCGRFWDSEDE